MPEKNVQVNTDRGLPYERFLQFGPENLTEAELLAVILRTGTKEDSAVALAEKVLALATYQREGRLDQSGSCGGIFYGKSQTQGYRMCVSALSGCQRTADP